MSEIKLYKDDGANAIFIEDPNGAQFLNSLQATSSSSKISITDTARQIEIVSDSTHTDFVNKDNVTYSQISILEGGGGTAVEVIDILNSIFQSSGTPSGEPPSITSSLAISSVEGNSINYELTALYGVGYEWDFSSVSGITTVNGNPRKLVGGTSLSSGTYNIPVKAINYNGEDSKTIVLTVSTPPYSNTKSIKFSNQDYLGANASLLSSTLGRTGNGSGSNDSWSISMWYKGSNNSQGQVILYFGDNDTANGGYIQLMQVNSSGNKLLRLRYGSNNNNLRMQTTAGSIVPDTWQHILISYDGGTTGSSSASLNSYYSRFKIYIDGALQARTDSHLNYGYTGGIEADNFRVGRFVSGNHMRDCGVDELAIWDSDQSGNVSSIYNGALPFDLMSLTVKPSHWWRMGDGDTYPYLQDSGTENNCIFQMYRSESVV